MAACQCAGETCNCKAIQVAPKLSFWKKHDRSVSGFVAWVALLNIAFVASIPLVIYAQEPPVSSATAAPSVLSGLDACWRNCASAQARCLLDASAGGTKEQNAAACELGTQECRSHCKLAPQLDLPANPAKAAPHREAKTQLATAKKRAAIFSRNLASIRAKVSQVEKQGMQPPAGLKALLTEGEEAVARLKSATSTDDMDRSAGAQASMDRVADKIESRLAALEKERSAPKTFAAFEQQFRQFDRRLAAIKKVAGDDAALAARVSDVERALTELKTAYRAAKDAIASGDVETGFAALESKIPGLIKAYQDAWKMLSSAGMRPTAP